MTIYYISTTFSVIQMFLSIKNHSRDSIHPRVTTLGRNHYRILGCQSGLQIVILIFMNLRRSHLLAFSYGYKKDRSERTTVHNRKNIDQIRHRMKEETGWRLTAKSLADAQQL